MPSNRWLKPVANPKEPVEQAEPTPNVSMRDVRRLAREKAERQNNEEKEDFTSDTTVPTPVLTPVDATVATPARTTVVRDKGRPARTTVDTAVGTAAPTTVPTTVELTHTSSSPTTEVDAPPAFE